MSTHRAAKPPRPWRRRLLVGSTLLVSIGLIGYGTRGLWDRHQATHRAPDAPVAAGELDETPVPVSDCPETAADDPRIIRLGSLEVEGCIERVGTTDRQLDSPANIHVAGWFDESPRPGDARAKGLSIIDGHSSGRYKDGIFNKIGDFEDGSIFTVELGDGTLRRFEVTSVKTHRVGDTMRNLAVDAANQQATLALITCGGDYDAENHEFDRRVVVLATTAA